MTIQREFEADLLKWKSAVGRRPLVIRGARQVGKSFIVQQFARKHFTHFLEINFEKQPELKDLFRSLDVKKILNALSQYTNTPLRAGETLLFLDELQECPQALLCLRYFFEEFPDLHVVGAGSLLDFLLQENSEEVRVPVGRIEYRYLHPLSFREFLLSLGQAGLCAALEQMSLSAPMPSPLHQKLMQYVEQYLRIGGMPAVVAAYQEATDSLRYREIQAAIMQTYREDFQKYRTRIDGELIDGVFRRLSLYVTKKFKYSELYPGVQSRSLKRILEFFALARILTKVISTNANGLPLDAESDPDNFKFIFVDSGLIAQLLQLPTISIQGFNVDLINSGALAEQFVGQELLALLSNYSEPRLFYWQREQPSSQAEVDYLFAHQGKVWPVEVKAGTTGRLKSLRIFIDQKKSLFGIRISQHELSYVDKVLTVPLYAVSELPRLCNEAAAGDSGGGEG